MSLNAADKALSVVIVEAGSDRAALLARDVVEVQPLVQVTALPDAPASIEGIISLRGQIVAVLSLRRRLGRPAREPRLDDHLVVVDGGERRLALHVDRVVGLATIPCSDLQTEGLPEAALALGVARVRDGLLVVHDMAAFLSADDALALDVALTAARDA